MQLDLLDPNALTEAAFAALRARPGLYRQQVDATRHFWAVTRYAEVKQVLEDPRTFSSARGTGYVSVWDERPDPPAFRSLNASDGALHAELRRPLAGLGQGLDVSALLPELDAATDGVRDIADPLAIATLSRLLDLPDRPELFAHAHTALYTHPEDPAWSRAEEGLMARLEEIAPDRDRRFFLRLLLLAGLGASSAAVAGALRVFAEHPEQWPPRDLDTAVEEVLRWSSPVVAFGRYVTADVTLGGQDLAAGERVVVYFAAANRDEAVFPGGFDASRNPNPHLALGAGSHRCPGATLARAQVRAVLAALAGRRWELAGPVIERRSVFHRGIACLPMKFGPAPPME